MLTERDWLNADQAADYLVLSRRALYEAVRRGEIPAYRLGRRLRFRKKELERLLQGNASQLVGDI